MDTRLESLALRLVGENLRGNALALGRIGNEFMHDVVSVDRLDAEVVEELRDQRLPARDSACQRDSHQSCF